MAEHAWTVCVGAPTGARPRRAMYVFDDAGVRYELTGDEIDTLDAVGIEWLPEIMAVKLG